MPGWIGAGCNPPRPVVPDSRSVGTSGNERDQEVMMQRSNGMQSAWCQDVDRSCAAIRRAGEWQIRPGRGADEDPQFALAAHPNCPRSRFRRRCSGFCVERLTLLRLLRPGRQPGIPGCVRFRTGATHAMRPAGRGLASHSLRGRGHRQLAAVQRLTPHRIMIGRGIARTVFHPGRGSGAGSPIQCGP